MPFLKKLMADNITVPNFHANSCETINAELSINCSTFANSYEPVPYSHLNNNYYCLPHILHKKKQYETYFFHANLPDFWQRDTLIPKWGFEHNYFVPFFRQKTYDQHLFNQALDILSEEENPFYAYITTFTSHSPHNQELIDYHWDKNQLKIEPFNHDLNLDISNIEIPDEQTKLYLGFLQATDKALEFLINKIEKTEKLRNTVIFIVNDHRFYNFIGNDLQDFYHYNLTPFVMITPNHQSGQAQQIASHIDLAPTIMHLIDQEQYQKPDHFLGHSLFETGFPNQALNKCLGKIYFLNEKLIFQGNAKTKQYELFHPANILNDQQKNTWQTAISGLVKFTDQAIYSDQLTK